MAVSVIPEARSEADSTPLQITRDRIQQDFSLLQSCMQVNDLSEAQSAFSSLRSLLGNDRSDMVQTDAALIAELSSGSQQVVHEVVNDLLQSATLMIRERLKADRATIFMVDRENGQLVSHIAHGADGRPIDIRIPLGTGVAGRVADTGEEMNVVDPYNHPHFNREVDRSTGYTTRNILCLPIRDHRQSVFAVVQLINKTGTEGFSESDSSVLRNLTGPLGIILRICTRLRQVR